MSEQPDQAKEPEKNDKPAATPGQSQEFNYRDTPVVLGDALKELGRGLSGGTGKNKVKWGQILVVFIAFMLSNTSNGFSVLAFFIWLGIFWIISAPFRAASWVSGRMNSRPCPVCGIRIPNGETVCGSCGTDFRQR
ncbi:MAG: hypothetical protein RIS43_544 [Actinomycetota bacterium]